jgi:hypothetical protein
LKFLHVQHALGLPTLDVALRHTCLLAGASKIPRGFCRAGRKVMFEESSGYAPGGDLKLR